MSRESDNIILSSEYPITTTGLQPWKTDSLTNFNRNATASSNRSPVWATSVPAICIRTTANATSPAAVACSRVRRVTDLTGCCPERGRSKSRCLTAYLLMRLRRHIDTCIATNSSGAWSASLWKSAMHCVRRPSAVAAMKKKLHRAPLARRVIRVRGGERDRVAVHCRAAARGGGFRGVGDGGEVGCDELRGAGGGGLCQRRPQRCC